MHRTDCARKLVLVAVSAAVAGGAAAVPANAADARTPEQTTTISLATGGLAMLDPDPRRKRRHANDDIPKMGACTHQGCADQAREKRRKAAKEARKQWNEERKAAAKENLKKWLKRQWKEWTDFRNPAVKEQEELWERIREGHIKRHPGH
jgi:hypothetical protein